MKTTVKALIVAGILLGSAAAAEAAWFHHRRRSFWHHRPVRPAPIVKVYKHKPLYIPPRVVHPAPLPLVRVAPTTIVVPARAATVQALQADLARQKAKYASLCKTRAHLLNWLNGAGKYAPTAKRAEVKARLATVNAECHVVAARIAEIQRKLALL